MSVVDAIELACRERTFYYRRCACRVHKLVPFLGVGRCGACHEHPQEETTEEEWRAQR